MTVLLEWEYGCNLRCKYCYNAVRRASKVRKDFSAVRDTLERVKKAFGGLGAVVLHGGEPLIIPVDELESLFRMIVGLGGKPSVQTNGTLITEEHVVLFKKYGVSVGVSIDGYFPCNRFRGNERMTKRVLNSINMLVESGVNTNVISVISKANVGLNERVLMFDFVRDMDEKGVKGRLNPVVHDDPGILPSVKEFVLFYRDMAEFMTRKGITGWSPFQDIINALSGKGNVVCAFRPCWRVATPSAISVRADGKVTTCHKFTDGLDLESAMVFSPLRERVLMYTDCKGCKYFKYCFGGCPASGIGGDWRRKDRLCPVWKSLFEYYESMLRVSGVRIADVDVGAVLGSDVLPVRRWLW